MKMRNIQTQIAWSLKKQHPKRKKHTGVLYCARIIQSALYPLIGILGFGAPKTPYYWVDEFIPYQYGKTWELIDPIIWTFGGWGVK